MEELFATLSVTISPERLGTYLKLAGHDKGRALKLYLWNAQIGEAFHLPIQALEVGARNCINKGLSDQFGKNWWKEDALTKTLDTERRSDLETVFRRIKNRELELDTPQIVAGLSFGFWVGMLKPRYQPEIWSKQLRNAFPNLPTNRGRKSLDKKLSDVAILRNRIWHHEPIVKRDLSADYKMVFESLEWVCPSKSHWIKPHCRVPQLMRQKP